MKFTVGWKPLCRSTNLKSNASSSDKVSTTTFDYLALSMPVGKFGFGLGLVPYTSVGYKLEDTEDGNIQKPLQR